ncbi:serine/threonine protein kinase [Bradymonadaceae bacterium TMQ3]|uniref:Serine/threonine protein kinase n=1 Tax=Lujinxingia sediminis TaxID=2480984 RepID=A0ABY0CVZ4_9DELT|nr:serine/threonine-protein kinase [Lujinxingia sediminis]RDV39901.1 serine/threonine protein kinase [Bradymonadaceae bacterium TMQ3]RVU48053.1 serine/threonine protein kinase [Lujinxingia sediminis]TXC77352.1 protein kinase [Bradymonadales bacterium TMQ1]
MRVEEAPQVGDTLAQRYRLLAEIGSGGFGIIFRAHDLQQSRELAVKVLHAAGNQLDQQQLEQRFEREALMASSLRHPHSIRQYEYGRCPESNALYIAMELLSGETLAERIVRCGTFEPALVARVARGVLRALSAAHALDIVHRDLKPANIMLCDFEGERDFVKVLDFGIAKTMIGNHDLTSAGMTLGSPTYMPPELLLGKSPVPASDLYSLGLTLAETILGAPLVQGATPLERARVQIAPTPLPAPEVLARHPLWPWLSRALDKDVSQRYASSEMMLRALDQVMPPPREPATLRSPAVNVDATAEMAVNQPLEAGAAGEDAATMVMEALPVGMLEQHRKNADFGIDATQDMALKEEPDTHTDTRPLFERLESDADDATEMMENPLETLRQMKERGEGPFASGTPGTSDTSSNPTPAPSSSGPVARAQRPTYPTAPPQPASRGFGPSLNSQPAPDGQQLPAPGLSAPLRTSATSKPAWLTPLNLVVALLCVIALALIAILLLR